MGAGFHSIGRGTPGKQVTVLADTTLTTIVPTPPAGIARVIGVGGEGGSFNCDVSGNVQIHNPDAANTLAINFFIDGPDGNFQFDAIAALAAEGTNNEVIGQSVIIENGETIQGQIGGQSASTDANIVASWVDYRMDDVLKLNRVVFDSDVSTAFQDLVPAPPAGSLHTILGAGAARSSMIVGNGAGTLGIQVRFNDDGTLVDMGSVTPVDDVANALDAISPTVGAGESFQGAAVDGAAIAYISYLKVPANP
jgi:hypothetical protein